MSAVLFAFFFLDARVSRASWKIEFVDKPKSFKGTSLRIDAEDRLHVAYGGSHQLYYALCSGGAWRLQIVDSGSGSESCSLALDPSGRPVISYAGEGLKFAKWDGAAWNIDSVDSGAGDTSLAFDASGFPAICYFGSALKLARFDGAAWRITTVDSGRWGEIASLRLDASDNPVIAYYNGTEFRCARYDGLKWRIETLEADSKAWDESVSLALTRGGYPAIAYIPVLQRSLKLARLYPDRILRGSSPTSLVEIALSPLPWTDPEPVLRDAFPPLLFYQVDSVNEIFLIKEGESLRIFSY